MGNITQVHFKDGQESIYGITGLKQWDKGQKLEISGLDVDEYVEVHFSLQQYCGTAKRMLGKMVDGILHTDIPAFIMEGPEYICAGARTYSAYAWVYVSNEESAETIRKMEFVIEARAKPEEYVSPEDMGFLEQLEAEMKNKLDKSGHAPNKILATDAEGNVIAKDAEAEVDLSGYVKNTDYASSEKAGVVKVISNQGIEMDKEVISISPANRQTIDTKASYRMPIVPAHLDYAVMKALSDSKYAWTEEEKSNSRKLLGATGEDQLLQFAIKPTTDKASFHNIQDSANYRVLDIGMEGKTEQKSTSGKNLYNGGDIEYTKVCEKTVDIKAGTYTFSANVISSDVTNAMIQTVPWAGANIYIGVGNGNRTSVTVTYTNDISLIRFLLNDGESAKIKNLQIETGSTATPYEPYTGGQPSPNPEYPQEIVNAGEIYNLLNPEELENGLLLDENGNISTAGTYGDIYHIFKQTLPAGTYTLFVNGTRISVTRTILNGVFTNLNALVDKYTFTVESESEITICFRKEDSSAFDGTEEIQLNVGANAKPYKPYTGRYEIEYKVVNKNLWDKEYASSTNNWERVPDYIQSSGFYDMPIFVGKGNKFTLSYKDTPPAGLGIYAGIAMGHNKPVNYWFYNSSSSLIYRVVTMTATEDNIWIRCNGGGRESFMQYIGNDLQIEISSGEIDYTPHQSQNITLTSPVPLTKWDKLVKRDGVYGWSIQGKKYNYNADNIVMSGNNADTEKVRLYVHNANAPQKTECFCNMLKYWTNTRHGYCGYWFNETFCTLILNSQLKSYSYDETLTQTENVNNAIASFKQMVRECGEIQIWANMQEEQAFYQLPDSEQTLLKSLETYYGVTNIYNDQGCPMWLTYVADTKLYINNKILSIQTAMI